MNYFIKKYYLLLILLTISFYSANAQLWSGATDYTWRSGNVGIGSNAAATNAKLYLFNTMTGNSHSTLGGYSPGIKFNTSTFAAADWDQSTIGLASGANQFLSNSLANDFIFTNNTGGANILFGTCTGGSSIERMRIASTGRIGIGTNNPSSLLHIQNGNFQITNSGALTGLANAKTGLSFGSNVTSMAAPTDYSWIQSSNGPLLLNPLSTTTLTTQANNYVAIGYSANTSTTPGLGYNLLVAGKIMCEELKIKIKSGSSWPDYVFSADYKLMSVDSLQRFIIQNNHLPDVPSASEVEENGIMAGEMSGILLKKIEELTLYMIEQNKNMAVQNTQNEMQAQAISNQQEQIELLKKQNELLMQQLQLLVKLK